MKFVYPNEKIEAPETCPENEALWTSVWRLKGGGLRAYEMVSDTYWFFKNGRWQRWA